MDGRQQNFGIESIDFCDSAERKFFESSKKYQSFEDSWFALIQGIRYNPRVFLRKIYFSDYPYKKDTLVVFNHLCDDTQEFAELLDELLKRLNKKKVICKNVRPDETVKLQTFGFRYYDHNEGWNDEAKFDDQTFPQYVCSLKEMAFLQGPRFSQIRQQKHAVEKKHQAILLPYEKKFEENCIALVKQTSLNICKKKNIQLKNVVDANLIYVKHPPPCTYLVKIEDKICSFIAFDVRDSIANFNCLLYDRAIKYLATFTMVKAAQALEKIGINWLNLSGSESRSLNHWKRKFLPVETIHRTHMILQAKDR